MPEPYTIGEAKYVVVNHNMDIYHRELMEWLIDKVEALESELKQTKDKK